MVKMISGVCFFIAITSIVFLLLGVRIPGFSSSTLLFSALFFGAVATVVNLLNVKSSKHNVWYSILYWVSFLMILIGLLFRIMHWPFSKIILISGLVMMAIAMCMPKRKSNLPVKNDDLLDN